MEIFVHPVLINVVIILGLAVLLVKSADFITEGSVYIASRAGVGEFLVGFVVLAFVTSLPEISVALNSVKNGVPELTIGNLLGGSLVLITMVIGLNAVVHHKLPFHGRFKFREILASLLVIALPVLVLIDQNLSSSEGLILILAYGGLILQMNQAAHKRLPGRPKKPDPVRISNVSTMMIKTIIGIAGLILTSNLIVETAINTAELLDINIGLIGVFVLAIGTNLPELSILFRVKGGEVEEFAVGDFLGSASVNTAMIGAVGLLAPHILTNFTDLIPVLLLLTIAVILFITFARTKSEVSRQEGFLLIAVYLSMIAVELVYLTFEHLPR